MCPLQEQSDVSQQGTPALYLAQAPLTGQLAPLLQDLQPPQGLEQLTIASTNLWMNAAPCTSSLHYDPQHNLLCVITGRKHVQLWPPCCTHLLRPHSVFGESPNHSKLKELQSSRQLAQAKEHAGDRYVAVTLGPADALLIPAGWWHLVSSKQHTIAVNYWWQVQNQNDARQIEHMKSFHWRQHASTAASELVQHSVQQLRDTFQKMAKLNSCDNSDDERDKRSMQMAAHLLHQAVRIHHPPGRKEHQKLSHQRGNVQDACALLLCRTADHMLKVMCYIAHVEPEHTTCWLLHDMSDVCTQVMTMQLEGSLMEGQAPEGQLCRCNAWLRELSGPHMLAMLRKCLVPETWVKHVDATRLARSSASLQEVYSLVDADLLTQQLCMRKERLHAAAWRHLQVCKPR